MKCFLKSQINYPLTFHSNEDIITVILTDKKLGICGSETIYTEHHLECLEFLWKKHGCSNFGLKFSENLPKWMSNMTTKEIEDDMINVLLPPTFYINTNVQPNNSRWYRYSCFGPGSKGHYNIAAFKDTIVSNLISQDDLYHHSHVVDGTSLSDINLGSCTRMPSSNPWIAIDLREIYDIRTIEIIPPNCCSQNQTISVYAFSTDKFVLNDTVYENEICDYDIDLLTGYERRVIECLPNLKGGRFVKIQEESNNSLTLCEIYIYTSDLALGQPSYSSSSLDETSYPGAAVSEYYKLGECFVSIVEESHQWLSVYLGGFYLIRSAALLTKSLHDLEIFLTRQHPGLFWPPLERVLCNKLKNISETNFPYMVICLEEATGEFIVVYSLKDLHVCQLQVWGEKLTKSGENTKNIALHRPVALSSVHDQKYSLSYFATDGLSDSNMAATAQEDNPWISVDLLRVYSVKNIGILIRAAKSGEEWFLHKSITL
ncbi:DgyrCDS8118 [Dimorphilus gyrociliatus]|uniref:DgyrCDS8118 n=1 Tax=Dimorphilus gyrociliatus TaxID=2664684 RepID=A0A7I8VVN4_9ANNE|nr:DgyrCDS8118 [Dimorphilus gyrociliatus]